MHVRHLIKNNLDEYYFNNNNFKCKVVKYILNDTSNNKNNKKPMEYYILTNILDMSIEDLHLFSFQTPILEGKKIRKNVKSIVGVSPTIVLLFLLLFLFLKK